MKMCIENIEKSLTPAWIAINNTVCGAIEHSAYPRDNLRTSDIERWAGDGRIKLPIEYISIIPW